MSLKKKLLISIGSLSLVAVITVVAVFAAIQQGLGITSTVSFQVKNVAATVACVVSGAETNPTVDSVSFVATEENTTKTMAIGALDFVQVKGETNNIVNDIVYTFTITNNDTVNALKVVTTATSTEARLSIENSDKTGATGFTIEAGDNATVTFTLNILGGADNNTAGGNISSDLDSAEFNPNFAFTSVEA